MSLIKCPECGREISDKASTCIYCGFPLKQEEYNELSNIDNKIQNIQSSCDTFMSNPDLYDRDFGGIYPSVKGQIDSINNMVNGYDKEQRKTIDNKIALVILDIATKGSDFCSWKTYKSFYELVNFDNLSDETMKKIADEIHSELSHITRFADSWSGNSEHIMLWYPIYQILTYATEDIKKPILENLSLPNSFGGKRYDDVQGMASSYLHINSGIERIQKDSSVPKCPTCGSTNIERISLGKKAFGGVMFGLFSSDVRRTMHCKNCGYKW